MITSNGSYIHFKANVKIDEQRYQRALSRRKWDTRQTQFLNVLITVASFVESYSKWRICLDPDPTAPNDQSVGSILVNVILWSFKSTCCQTENKYSRQHKRTFPAARSIQAVKTVNDAAYNSRLAFYSKSPFPSKTDYHRLWMTE